MTSPRVYANQLAKLLNSAKQPIYVLDDDLVIVFLNQACEEWLGAAADGLLGRQCAYHSSTAVAGPDATAAGLCPPPQTLTGGISAATVSRIAEDGTASERRARFFCLGTGEEDFFAVVAIVEAADSPPDSDAAIPAADRDADASPSEAIALHEQVRRFRQEAAARYRADRLIGQGPVMCLARRQVELAAASRASVLLVGPPGSGRQHLAAAVHYGAEGREKGERERGDSPPSPTGGAGVSPARAREKGDSPHLPERPRGCFAQMGTVPFFPAGGLVPLDCSLLGEDFLDAAAAAVARGISTLLIHRVDELTSDTQVQLADFLARRPAGWRLIATAAVPLAELARRGNFRAELAALLSTITIELPPLMQRRDDLPLLAQMFLEEHNAAGPRQIGGFSPAALDRLDAYAWPGNLDELAQVVAEAYARAGGSEIGPADLPERLHASARAAAVPRRTDETIVLDEYLARVERELIRRAVARAKGNKARAARLLGVTRPRLYRRMVQLGLESP